MKKSTERILVFIFGVVFLLLIFMSALFIPEPKPFQWNVFKTIIALAGAGIAAFIPGFIDVNVNNMVRAGGALGVFVVLFFFNPARLVIDYPAITRKYNLTAFQLARDVTTADFVILQVNQGDSTRAAAARAAAKEQLDVIQNRMAQLDIQINLKKLFEVTGNNDNVFPQSKFQIISDAINENYSRETVNYFKVGRCLTWVFIQASVVSAPEALRDHPEYLQQYQAAYPAYAAEANLALEQLGFSERLPRYFKTIAVIQERARQAQSAIITSFKD